MLDLAAVLLLALTSTLRTRRELMLENPALRQQLTVAKRHLKKSSLTDGNRLFWSCSLAAGVAGER